MTYSKERRCNIYKIMENSLVWKDVVGYEGLYQVNNRGEIKSLIKNIRYNKLINGAVNDGYRYVWLYKDKKASKCAVHQIVAKAFIPNPNGYKQINH